MSLFYLVEAGAIVEGPRTLPKAWRNISGLNLVSVADLAVHGWLPEEQIGYTPFDPQTQVRTGPVHDIQAAKVVATYTVRAKMAQEISDEKDARRHRSS